MWGPEPDGSARQYAAFDGQEAAMHDFAYLFAKDE
jgi:hypothetical protein